MGGFVFISVLLLLLFECEFSCYIHMSLKCNWNEREKCVEHIKSVEIIFHLSEPPVLISLSFSVFSIFVCLRVLWHPSDTIANKLLKYSM